MGPEWDWMDIDPDYYKDEDWEDEDGIIEASEGWDEGQDGE